MSFRPFISATREDLEDCREVVIDAARMGGDVEPLTMETWAAEAVNAVEVCKDRVREGTHYVGLFAHRRGWVPPMFEGKSITEAEYDWAADYRKPKCVFMPKKATEIDLELRQRAAKQSEIDATAQKVFIQRVREVVTCEDFKSVTDLAIRATRRFMLWKSLPPGGVREENKRVREAAVPTPQKMRTPSEDDISTLGREEQIQKFTATLNALLRPGLPRAVCFLIHGPVGRGHLRLARHLRRELVARWRPKEYQVSLSPLWREDTVTKLIRDFGRQLGPGFMPASVEDFAARLRLMLDDEYVVLEVDSIQRLGGLRRFVEDFWHPLVGALGGPTKRRLVSIATLEEGVPSGCEAYLQPPLEGDVKTLDPSLPVGLPELGVFTEGELRAWLNVGRRIEEEDALVLAQSLVAQTRGEPQLLYSILADDSTWVY
jgi:hypothetical protein